MGYLPWNEKAPTVPPMACRGLVLAARLGSSLAAEAATRYPPALLGVMNHLIANRFQHLWAPSASHSEPLSPSWGVNTTATSAAPETVNKSSGETITLLT